MTQESTPYSLAARFPNKNSEGKVYEHIQAIIFEEDCELSAYSFFEQNERERYVVVLGEEPSLPLHQRLATILFTLTRGVQATLDSQTLAVLMAPERTNTIRPMGRTPLRCQLGVAHGRIH